MFKKENPLTPEQQTAVQSNMYLVDAVIRTRIQTDERVVGLSYEDVRQEGYLLLCKAAQTYNPERAKLSTYASKVIYNGLVSHCRRINNQQTHISLISLTESSDRMDLKKGEQLQNRIAQLELDNLLAAYAREYTGITRLGVEALIQKTNGMGVTEIAKLYRVPPSHIGAWISRAKNKLKSNEDFLKDIA